MARTKERKPGPAYVPALRGNCPICDHAKRDEIDAAIVRGDTANEISRRFLVGLQQVYRHRRFHLGDAGAAALVSDEDARAMVRGSTLIRHTEELRGRALAILDEAENRGDTKTQILVLRETTRLLDLLGRFGGLIGTDNVSVHVVASPEFLVVQANILRALAPFPEARAAVVAALTRAPEAPTIDG